MTETTDLRTRLLKAADCLDPDCDAIFWLPRRELVALLREAAASLPPAPSHDTTCDNDIGRRCSELWPNHRDSWCEGCLALPPVSEGTRRPLCRCPDGFCWLHPGLTTCGMRATSVLPRAETPLAGTPLRPCETLGCGCFYDSLGRLAVACPRHTGSTLPRAADPAGGETPTHYVPEDQRVNCVDSPTDQHGKLAWRHCHQCGGRRHELTCTSKRGNADCVCVERVNELLEEIERLRSEASSAPASQEKP